jgi:hypothetical protein
MVIKRILTLSTLDTWGLGSHIQQKVFKGKLLPMGLTSLQCVCLCKLLEGKRSELRKNVKKDQEEEEFSF